MRKGNLFSAGRVLSAFVRHLQAEEYDVVLDFHGIVKSALLARTARTARRIGFDRTFAKEASWLAYDEKIGCPEKRVHKVRRNMLLWRIWARRRHPTSISRPLPSRCLHRQFLVASTG